MDKVQSLIIQKIGEIKKALKMLDQYEKHWPDYDKTQQLRNRLHEELDTLKMMIEKKPL